MLRHRLFLASSIMALAALCCQVASAQIFTPIKPPAPPLITRAPYLNTWLHASNGVSPGIWPAHWNGVIKAITGIAMIDGKSYLFMGAPNIQGLNQSMFQESLTTTPTQSIFMFNAGGVNLTVDLLSPVEAKDLRRLSMPLADIITTAQSSDGNQHTVTLYFDISGEWTDRRRRPTSGTDQLGAGDDQPQRRRQHHAGHALGLDRDADLADGVHPIQRRR